MAATTERSSAGQPSSSASCRIAQRYGTSSATCADSEGSPSNHGQRYSSTVCGTHAQRRVHVAVDERHLGEVDHNAIQPEADAPRGRSDPLLTSEQRPRLRLGSMPNPLQLTDDSSPLCATSRPASTRCRPRIPSGGGCRSMCWSRCTSRPSRRSSSRGTAGCTRPGSYSAITSASASSISRNVSHETVRISARSPCSSSSGHVRSASAISSSAASARASAGAPRAWRASASSPMRSGICCHTSGRP